MPKKPNRPCRITGCPNLAEDGKLYCSEHKGMDMREYNHYRREPEANKRYGRAWKRIRNKYITEHPMCEECFKNNIYKPADEVHHKLPISDGGTNERSNLVSLCHSCHMKAHGALGKESK